MFRSTGLQETSQSANKKTSNRAGFTLIEVLVAFIVLAITLGAVFEVFSTGLRTSRIADENSLATLRTRSLLEGVGIEQPLAIGETDGTYADGSTWQITIEPAYEYQSEPYNVALSSAPKLVWVTTTVFWGDSDSRRTTALKTLRFASR